MDRADQWFSRWIRLTFCDVYNGMPTCKCYTCGTRKQAKNMQCGHWQRRGYKTTRFHPDNARPQCTKCNKWGSGKPEIFEIKLRKEIGDKRVDKLKIQAQNQGQDNEFFYKEQAKIYRELTNELVKKREIDKWWK